MYNPVDLRNLREMTDGDTELERELFDEFISSTEEYLEIMKANTEESGMDTWRSRAHALKGVSKNLGAEKLGDLLEEAQTGFDMNIQMKQQILGQIYTEFAMVKEYLEKLP